MTKSPSSLKDRALNRLASATARRLEQRRGGAAPTEAVKHGQFWSLRRRVDDLEAAVQENRRLNQRLADVIDVVTEVLIPAADRDDERMKEALARLNKTL